MGIGIQQGKTNQKKKAITHILCAVMLVATVTALSGCAEVSLWFNDLKGSLIGNKFDVSIVDNYGNQVTSFHSGKVDVEAESTDEDGNADSSVIRITADGHDITQVGNTVIFAEEGLGTVKDFSLPEENDTKGDGTITLFDRNINKLRNSIGRKKTVVISSQLGIPIAVYQGDNVGYEVPKDLPKMTKLTIDGKALYIHRANYVIMDTEAIGN